MKENINWKIGGQAGYGIMVTGLMFAKTCLRHGWEVFCYTEYPSLIRGGHNTYQVHAAKDKVNSQKKKIEVLVALDQNTVTKHLLELSAGGVIIFDPEKVKVNLKKNLKVQSLAIPIAKISKEICDSDLMKDTVALGASLALYKADFKILVSVIKDVFKSKSAEIIKQNIEAAKKGYDAVKPNSKIKVLAKLSKIKSASKIIVTGNEAIGLGALAAGCKFYVAYPMTPATALLHFMAKNERAYDLVVKQAEDEIAVINMAIGASFTGVRSMCATSGGGFALMNESFGFSGIAEIPLVLMEGQRTGPATGLPTWTGQGDLLFAINASHGEFLRIVVAPGDVQEAFTAAVSAFNLAEKYQLPVIILTDKYLIESPQSTKIFSTKGIKIDRGQILIQSQLNKIKDFKRYKFTSSGISPRSLPGAKGGEHQANSDDHDEYGFSTEDIKTRNRMMAKRAKKIQNLIKELPDPKIYGNKKASRTVICWGSTKMPVLEALKQNNNFKVVHLQYLCPFPVKFFTKNIINPQKSMIIEGNHTAQLKQLIRQQTGLNISKTLLKYDGRPFYPEEIIEAVKRL